MNETEQLEKQLNSILHSYISYNLDETIRIDPSLIEGQILQACNQWLEENRAEHQVIRRATRFDDEHFVYEPLRLEIDA